MIQRHTTLLALAALLPGAALADTVVTNSGDRLNGTVTSMREGELVLETPYAEVTIPWGEIRSVTTEGNAVVTLKDGTQVIGVVTVTEDGRLSVQPEDAAGPVVFDPAAVTKIHPGDTPEPALKTSGFVNIGLRATNGNTDSESYYGSGEFVARTESNRYTIGFSAIYAEEDDETSANEKRAYGRYDHFVSEKWYVNANMSFLRDEFKDLRLRSTLGAGMGYQALETDDTNLALELGGSYIREDYEDIEDAEDDSSVAARWALDFTQELFDDGMTLFHNHELLKGVGEDNALFLAYTRTGVRFPLVAGLNGTAQVNYDYDDNPQGDNAYADTTYLFTLGYTF
ncbi:DUF481 domain-containing protein [Ectothiorhodospiraceae bacterium WFHF3C12]|nr:DUF481 domain-containing protein [Ectothiorhodospiraceae bacterium WFHF3C12]